MDRLRRASTPGGGPSGAPVDAGTIAMRKAALTLWTACLVLAAGLLPALRAAAADAQPVGEAVCLRCHASEGRHFAHTVHARAFGQNPRSERERQGCEACHGPGSAHVANATDRSAIIGFTRGWGTPVAVQNGQCQGCHQGRQRIYWPGSTHDVQGLACSDCHNPMARHSASGLLRNAGVSETCYGCHAQQRAEFRKRSHMPLPEGQLSCTSCHNPHGSATRPLLKTASVNELCSGCHADKRGPFIWEHAPVRESCLNCHEPHGSNHEVLLVAPRPFLCQQCHTNRAHQNKLLTAPNLAGGAEPDVRLVARGCQTCHTQIHGSNHPSGVRLQR